MQTFPPSGLGAFPLPPVPPCSMRAAAIVSCESPLRDRQCCAPADVSMLVRVETPGIKAVRTPKICSRTFPIIHNNFKYCSTPKKEKEKGFLIPGPLPDSISTASNWQPGGQTWFLHPTTDLLSKEGCYKVDLVGLWSTRSEKARSRSLMDRSSQNLSVRI